MLFLQYVQYKFANLCYNCFVPPVTLWFCQLLRPQKAERHPLKIRHSSSSSTCCKASASAIWVRSPLPDFCFTPDYGRL